MPTPLHCLALAEPAATFAMMIANRIIRLVHTNSCLWQSSNKTLLSKLRKKTGYTFSNCKKALELHNNDLEKSETWLREQAQALGWSKAEKLQGRTTAQGLIAVIVDKTRAALVEINCETDFVARNKHFRGLADTVASAVLRYSASSSADELVAKTHLDSDALKAIPAHDGKSLADHTALVIGTVGENLGIKRALCMCVRPEVHLAWCTHPRSSGAIQTGKYAALVAFTGEERHEKELGMQLCQHVIGMNPAKIGDVAVDEPNPVADDETTMIYQEFLLDPSLTVRQVLIDAQLEVLDFARFEVGETLAPLQTLDTVETCG